MTIQQHNGDLENASRTVRISTATGGWSFKRTDALSIEVTTSSAPPAAHISIYGKPAGLLQLSDFLRAIALVDQMQIADRNCPPNEGMHTTLVAGVDFLGSNVSVDIGRLDCKGDGTTDWFTKGENVS